jgi:hypothetical protein
MKKLGPKADSRKGGGGKERVPKCLGLKRPQNYRGMGKKKC